MNDDPKRRLTSQDVEAEGLSDWRILFRTLHARFETGSFATGLELVNRIGAAAEERNHHPDIDLSYPRVDVRLTSHDTGGVTSRDVELARTISGYAAELGAHGRHGRRPGPGDRAGQRRPRGDQAVLGRRARSADVRQATISELVDGVRPAADAVVPVDRPARRTSAALPPGHPGASRGRRGRIQAALDAGGTLVTDERAPTFWVLADAQGNKVCVTTWQGRSH